MAREEKKSRKDNFLVANQASTAGVLTFLPNIKVR